MSASSLRIQSVHYSWSPKKWHTSLSSSMTSCTSVFKMATLFTLCLAAVTAHTTDSTTALTDGGGLTTIEGNLTSWPEAEQMTTTMPTRDAEKRTKLSSTISRNTIVVESLPSQLTNYMYEVKEGDLQDIEAEESNNMNNVYIHFESQKFKPNKDVEVTSFLADSESAVTMDVEEAIQDVKNRSSGADMISAFFVAPEDEVNQNQLRIDKKKAEDRGDTRPELYREESNDKRRNQYEEANTTPLPQVQNSLTNDILAPLRAAVSLSHDSQDQPEIEKQMIKEMPVYKTYIEIQKSIPIELKEEPPKEEPPNPQYAGDSDLLQQLMLSYQLPQYRSPLYYRYPMYYLPQSYIGNYIMRHSHENTGVVPYLYRPRPMYYYISPYQAPVAGYSGGLYPGGYGYPEEHTGDQNSLQTEQVQSRLAPMRPSQPVFSSVYPPETYRVAAVMQGRGAHARSVRSKQLCIEYGGFKPPMVPSVQVDEAGIPQKKSSIVEGNADS